jgi:hypothetical protein
LEWPDAVSFVAVYDCWMENVVRFGAQTSQVHCVFDWPILIQERNREGRAWLGRGVRTGFARGPGDYDNQNQSNGC